MATSGSANFTVTAQEIVTAALRKVGVIKNDTPAAPRSHLDVGLQELNLLVKAWQADGLQLWARERATLFLALNDNTYNLGSTGDHATLSYVETALATDEANGSVSLGVDSIAGITNGDYIGIILDDGTLHWTTVNGAPSGTTVVITTGLASAASTDNPIYTYTTKINRPLRILEMFRRDSDNTDTSITMVSLQEYAELSDKSSDGTVLQVTYDPQLTNGKLYIWPEQDDLTTTLEFWYHRPFEDFDNFSNNPDFPSEWYLALVYGLADILADNYDVDPQKASRLHKRAVEYKQLALDFSVEDTSIFFQPDDDR